ncbi:MAG TPA: PAS domain-containing protein [Clostridia bacterium]|nr:PAS domain-containing protein [Clostridia bacterium]
MKEEYCRPIALRTLIVVFAIMISLVAISPVAGDAIDGNCTVCVNKTFNEHGSVMMFIEPTTGDILYANDAAVEFYGHTRDQLISMSISELNTSDPEQLAAQMLSSLDKEENYFVLEHRLAGGELRTVEVHSYPTQYDGKTVLFSIIHDITSEILLKEEHRKMEKSIFIVGIVVLGVLLFLILNLHWKAQLVDEKNREFRYWNELRETFNNANTDFVYLKDEQLKYIFANKALEGFFQLSQQEIVGKDNESLFGERIPNKFTEIDRDVLEQHRTVIRTIPWGESYFKVTKFPVEMPNGSFGVGSYTNDVTKERKRQQARTRMLKHNRLLLEMLTRTHHGKQEQLDYALDEFLKISGSQYGYIYFYSEEREEFVLNSWTKGTMKDCTVKGEPRVYQLVDTGIWGEVVRQRKPIVVNDFESPNPLKKGYPEGHVSLKRFMSVPVIIDDKIVAVVGLANKPTDYDKTDVREMTTLMSGVWNAVQRREAKDTLIYERNKYYQTLLSIGDGVMVVDHDGNIEFMNLVACELTGWTQREAIGVNYKEVLVLSHEKKGFSIIDPIEMAFATGEIQELENHVVLTSKEGDRRFLEDSAAPIFDDRGELAGVVLVFRDVTEKREQRLRIEYLSYHDSLTGLYNRAFFEEEMRRLDTERNLPVSILIGDVDSLKLTNDIFGHAYGDMLLKRVAEVMVEICRADDIIARWGGDEFTLLLPKTGPKEAERISQRVKEMVSKQQIKAIKCSISISCDTKTDMTQDLVQTLDNAEAKMYQAKILEQDDMQYREFNTIMDALYTNNENEERHATNVCELCRKMGFALGLPESDIQRLAKAGLFHDIGKVILDPDLLYKDYPLHPVEQKEVYKHPEVGYRILSYFSDTIELAEAVLAHHERWDGTGYPRGLRGEEIPLHARVISIAEVYDKMLHSLPNDAGVDGKDRVFQ